jgi:predicted nucleotidyltransferase
MDKSRQAGGFARARSLSPVARSRIARKAARARWASPGRGILTIPQIRKTVREALAGRDAKAFLFGSYARGEANSRSDVDILVIEKTMPADWLGEVAELQDAMDFDKDVDLVVLDDALFDEWKDAYGTVQHAVAQEGVRLA